MSRLAKKPIILPSETRMEESGKFILIKGPKGELTLDILPFLKIESAGSEIKISPSLSIKQSRANAGTMWSLIKNAVEGVTKGFSKVLEIEGVGYRASMDGKTLVLNIGFVNPIRFIPPANVSVSVDKNTIKIEGLDKALVGRVAGEIRGLKKPEPYKGKGIRYQGEIIKRKAGKKAVAAQ